MTARTHDLAAISLLGLFALFAMQTQITLGTALLAIVANQLGGIAPDIDQPTAPLWRNLPILKIFGSFFDDFMGGHRFISHSIIGTAGFGFVAWAFLKFLHPSMPHVNIGVVWWAFMVGFVSHLIMDTFTKEGVPWLLPIPFKIGLPPVKALRITTGEWMERLVFLALLAFDIWFVSGHYSHLLTILHQQII
jgi:inner membrane protein